MAISGDLRVCATMASYPTNPVRRYFPPSKVGFNSFQTGGSSVSEVMHKWPRIELDDHSMRCESQRSWSFGIIGDNQISAKPVNEETEGLLLSAINMSFLERLDLAWKILFPPPATVRNSNARIAKQRLKMILFSDRCAVSDEAKQKIVSNVVDLGTIYSVTVPVRRVKSKYQVEDESGMITNVEYKDTGDSSGTVDVKFDFFVPTDAPWQLSTVLCDRIAVRDVIRTPMEW
ncbi:hypothetical protein IFM89_034383 [Coptis chinensis]|uniref:Uncharacterized protein n=1 Tax=Coptis chinensis TaxID=261450 RepID=A0A835IZ81_9MAGN|nr:hypothetical protein IFM89_034383 [Coptis chinensis]